MTFHSPSVERPGLAEDLVGDGDLPTSCSRRRYRPAPALRGPARAAADRLGQRDDRPQCSCGRCAASIAAASASHRRGRPAPGPRRADGHGRRPSSSCDPQALSAGSGLAAPAGDQRDGAPDRGSGTAAQSPGGASPPLGRAPTTGQRAGASERPWSAPRASRSQLAPASPGGAGDPAARARASLGEGRRRADQPPRPRLLERDLLEAEHARGRPAGGPGRRVWVSDAATMFQNSRIKWLQSCLLGRLGWRRARWSGWAPEAMP